MEEKDVSGAEQMLRKNWGLEAQAGSWEELRAALSRHFVHLLNQDLEALVQAMYRLDVSEPKFHAAMAAENTEERASKLADVVLERELQRLATWRKYSNNKHD